MLQFPTFLTDEEVDFGFSIKPAPTGTFAAVAELRDGLFAVKVRVEDGPVEYRVCNRWHVELYATASTLEELRIRFAAARAHAG